MFHLLSDSAVSSLNFHVLSSVAAGDQPYEPAIYSFIEEHFTRLASELSQGRSINPIAWRQLSNLNSYENSLSKLLSSLYSNPPQPPQSNRESKEQVIQKKNSEKSLWQCVDCNEDTYGGLLFTFRFKEEELKSLEVLENRFLHLFPAIEETACDLAVLNPPRSIKLSSLSCDQEFRVRAYLKTPKCGFSIHQDNNSESLFLPDISVQKLIWNGLSQELEFLVGEEPLLDLELIEFLPYYKGEAPSYIMERASIESDIHEMRSLGYTYSSTKDGSFFTAPDSEALLSRWKVLQRTYPERDLPDLRIADSEGVADDMAFVSALMHNDALLSSGPEFFHDSSIHLLAVLPEMLKGRASYQENRLRFVSALKEGRSILMTADAMQHRPDIDPEIIERYQKFRAHFHATLGAIVDSNSVALASTTDYFDEATIESFWSSEEWLSYWRKRFPDRNLDATFRDELKSLWRAVQNSR